jgi:tRNA-intron endonuclease, archaea type
MFVLYENNKYKVENNNLKSMLVKKGFGHKNDLDFFLEEYEVYYLLSNKKIKIKDKSNKIIPIKKIKDLLVKKIKDFETKYLVYKEFRDSGNIIKDGTTFGFDFRVYKKKENHTDFVVDVKKSHKDTLPNIVKSERLAKTINAKYVLCIVTLEKKILKLKIENL